MNHKFHLLKYYLLLKVLQRFIYINNQVNSNLKFKNLSLYTLHISLNLKPLVKLKKAPNNLLVR